MMKRIFSLALLAALAWTTWSQVRSQRSAYSAWNARDRGGIRLGQSPTPAPPPGEIVEGVDYGDPLRGITAREFERFRLGLEDFLEVEEADEGLGPAFNGRSCAQCHSIPAIGGVATVMEVRAGVLHDDGSFEELPGGTVFQMFSIPTHSAQAVIPPEANVVAHRKPLPLFGDGLVEAVPDEFFLALEDPEDSDGDGISGRAHLVLDRNSGQQRVGRFGWKAQQAALITFGAEAYRDEMGITNDLFRDEACPGGNREAIEFNDLVADPEDGPDPLTGLRGIDNFESFMKFLGPPPRGPVGDEERRGEAVFHAIGCTSCHLPYLKTGRSSTPALDSKVFAPYGDFLLHDIGSGDGIRQGDAGPREIRTTPLWGVRFRAPFFHDGRASTLDQAIRLHDGEARAGRQRFEALSKEESQALLAFLKSL